MKHFHTIHFMRIYIKTPLYNSSKIVPHLVEHCIGHHFLDLKDFFAYNDGAEIEISDTYTRIEIDRGTDYQYMLQSLLQAPSKKAFQYEKAVVKKELDDCSYGQLLYEAVLQKVANKSLQLNTFTPVSFEEILKYHQRRYTKKHMLVCDDDFNLLFEGYTPKNHPNSKGVSFSFPFVYDKDSYVVFGKKRYSKYDYREYFLSYFILGGFCIYQQRRQLGEYYYSTPYLYQFERIIWITTPYLDMKSLKKDFFMEGKKYLITLLSDGYYKSKFFLNTYFYGVSLSREEAIAFLETYSRTQFQTFHKAFRKMNV